MPERNRIVVLNCIEQIAVEEVQPYNYADLSLIDEHEENDHRNTDPPLQRRKRTEGPDPHPAGFISVEIPVGDPHDLSYYGELRHYVDKDRENRDRQLRPGMNVVPDVYLQ